MCWSIEKQTKIITNHLHVLKSPNPMNGHLRLYHSESNHIGSFDHLVRHENGIMCLNMHKHRTLTSFLHQLTATIRVAVPFLFSKRNAWRPVKRILAHKREKEKGAYVMRLASHKRHANLSFMDLIGLQAEISYFLCRKGEGDVCLLENGMITKTCLDQFLHMDHEKFRDVNTIKKF